MVINHNISALNTFNQLSKNEKATASSLQKLSSGLRINSAADDAAGLAISQKMTAQVNGLDQAKSNAQNGISFVQTAEGGLNETQSILQRMRELAVQSSNDTNKDVDRGQIQKEVDQLASEITDIANDTEFNSQKLLNGGISDAGISKNVFQVGANAGQQLDVSIGAMDAKTLGVARDTITASLAAGATKVTGVELGDSLGTGVVSGATPALTANNTGAKTTWTAGDTGLTDMTISSKTQSSTYNDYTISINKGGTAGAAPIVTLNGSQITITAASDATKLVAADLNTAFAGLNLEADADSTALVVKTPIGASTAGFGADEVKLSLGTDSTIVKNNATSATFTGTMKGVTLLFNGTTLDNTVAATVDVTTDTATAATFAGGAVVKDAHTSGGIDVSSRTTASTAITTIDDAIKTVSDQRSQLGAYENRLDHTINNLGVESQNLQSASSQITDVDMAQEMMTYTKNNILNQAAQAMLAQANQLPQGVLQLLK